MNITEEEYQELMRRRGGNPPPEKKKSKYNAKKTWIDGICFDSKAEANYYAMTKMLVRAGELHGFLYHGNIVCTEGEKSDHRAVLYEPDFVLFNVRAELSPKNKDVFSDIDGWKFSVDQDITPEWFDEKDCAERMRKAVKEWANTHIFVGQNKLKISQGENIFIKDCKNVEICDNATVENICGKATVENIHGNATVERICGKATVKDIRDNATVKSICGKATVISSSYSKWNNSESLIISDNATFKDCYSKTIYQAGGWKLVEIKK